MTRQQLQSEIVSARAEWANGFEHSAFMRLVNVVEETLPHINIEAAQAKRDDAQVESLNHEPALPSSCDVCNQPLEPNQCVYTNLTTKRKCHLRCHDASAFEKLKPGTTP